MRLWTEARPYDRQIWDFYKTGERLVCGGGGDKAREFLVTGKRFDWDGARPTMRVELELI
jgi:hypothetical protein